MGSAASVKSEIVFRRNAGRIRGGALRGRRDGGGDGGGAAGRGRSWACSSRGSPRSPRRDSPTSTATAAGRWHLR